MDTGFQRRRARTPSPGRRDHQPGGPVTASEWSDQIEWLQRQLTGLNRTVNDHAHLIGKMKTELETTIPAIVQRISNLETSVNKRFEDGSIAINRKIDTIQAELRSFAVHMQSPPKPPDPPPGMGHHTAENFNVASPTERRPADNPYAMPGVDIWQNLGPGHVPTGAAPTTPPPVNRNMNTGDFGFDDVSLSSHGGPPNGLQSHPPNVRFERPTASPNSGATHRQFRQPSYSQHVHAPMWNSVPNDDFKISRKQISDLPIFDGDYAKYSHWKNKLTDHCADTNVYWRAILKHVQEATGVIDYYQLVRVRYGNSTGWDLALDMWSFISKRVGQTIYDKRVQLANGVDGNGFELWRALFAQYEGGDEFVKLDGRTQLQNFPEITSTNNITEKLKDWQHQMARYGTDIGPLTRKTMLLKILPENLRIDVLKYGMHDPDAIIGWIAQTQTWTRTAETLKKRRGSVTPVLPNYGNGPSPGGCDIQAASNSNAVTPELIAAVVAAIGGQPNVNAVGQPSRGRDAGKQSPRSRSPRSKSPRTLIREKFPKNHCYHCNSPDHSRTANAKSGRAGCEAFAKILKENGGKLPATYKGAFEKFLDVEMAKLKDKKPKKIAALSNEQLLEWLDEDSDTSDSDSERMCGAVWKSVGPPCCDPFARDQEFPPMCYPTATNNSFAALSDCNDDDLRWRLSSAHHQRCHC